MFISGVTPEMIAEILIELDADPNRTDSEIAVAVGTAVDVVKMVAARLNRTAITGSRSR